MLTAPLLALALVLSPPTAFDAPDTSYAMQGISLGSGDSAPGGAVLPGLLSGALGVLASGTLAFFALTTADVGFPGMTFILALGADVLVQALIPRLFGFDRNFLTSSVAVLGGVAGAVAGALVGAAIGRASNPSGGGFADLGLALLGMAVGFAFVPPFLTLWDPFGFSRAPVPVSVRVLDARPVERS